jgi:hypothetical protein
MRARTRDALAAGTAVAALTLLLSLPGSASGATILQNSAETLSDFDGNQSTALAFDGVPSSCPTNKATSPGTSGVTPGDRSYDAFSFTNSTGASQCVTVVITGGCAGNDRSAAYLGSFNPADPTANYLADQGASNAVYSFVVANTATFVVVNHKVQPTSPDCNYGMRVTTAQVPTVRSAAGADAAAIQSTVDQFRTDLGGGTTAGANGSFGGVRREINWDAVPDCFAAPNDLPANFFNSNSPRGAVFSTAGTGFQVSATAASGTAPEFGNINAAYPAQFQPFSPERLFTALGSRQMDVDFFLPATGTPATTTGFGAVFSDAGNLSASGGGGARMQLFGPTGIELGVYQPTVANDGLSFLGAFFTSETIGKVRLFADEAPAATQPDADVFDDFIYREPTATPNGAPGPAANTCPATGGTTATATGDGAQTGPGGAPAGAAAGTPAVQAFGAATKVALGTSSISVTAGGVAKVPLDNGNPFQVGGAITLDAAVGGTAAARKRKRRSRRVKLGSKSFSLAAGKRTVVKVRISRKGMAALRRRRGLRARATVVAKDPSGNKRTVKRNLKLKLAKKRKKRR